MKKEFQGNAPSSAIYGLGFIGAAIYFISTASGFLAGIMFGQYFLSMKHLNILEYKRQKINIFDNETLCKTNIFSFDELNFKKMKILKPRTSVAVFFLFFGVSALEAFRTRNWMMVLSGLPLVLYF